MLCGSRCTYRLAGANDAVLPGKLQHVPIGKFKENLNWFIYSIRSPSSDHSSPHTRILLFTPPPISEQRRAYELSLRDPPQELDRSWGRTKEYADAVKEVASSIESKPGEGGK